MTKSIGILGLGRFGRMVYDHLQHRNPRIWTRTEARLEGLAGAATFEETIASDFVILSVPISAMEETCRRIAPYLRSGQTIIDVCSVKVGPIRVMRECLPDFVQILGTHPLFGPDSGKDGIAGLKIVLCPVRIEASLVTRVRQELESLGLRVLEVSPEEHDRQAARTQAIFHLLARAMSRLGWGNDEIATPGPEAFFRQVTTLQNDSFQLFVDMQRDNPFAAAYRREFIGALASLDRELDD
jgi:prephenate dehydrogenase